MTDLRDRIAAVLQAQPPVRLQSQSDWLDWTENRADAVIAELYPQRCCYLCGRTGTQKFMPSPSGWYCRSIYACERRRR